MNPHRPRFFTVSFLSVSRLRACAAVLALAFAGSAQAQVRAYANGDSITFGVGASDGATRSYVPVLDDLLGPEFTVERDATGGATLLRRGQPSFFNTQGVANTVRANPDIILVLLGTNDSKPSNWAYRDEFVGDYLGLVDTYRAIPGEPDIYLCLPPPAAELPNDIRGSVIANEVLPRILEVARQRNLRVIDLHTPFLDSLSSLFPDGIHPNDEGHRIMAARIRDAIVSGRALRAVPAPWSRTDVGATGLLGAEAADEAGVLHVWGAGGGTTGAADAMRFVHQPQPDDVEVTARVAGVRNTDPLSATSPEAAAGVMLREGTGASARQVALLAGAGGVSLRWRDAPGASAGSTTLSNVRLPVWVRLRRIGNVVSGFYSTNGTDWRAVGSPRTLSLGDTQAGVAAFSGGAEELAQARFEQVQVSRLTPVDPAPVGADGRRRDARRGWANTPGGPTFRADYRETAN